MTGLRLRHHRSPSRRSGDAPGPSLCAVSPSSTYGAGLLMGWWSLRALLDDWASPSPSSVAIAAGNKDHRACLAKGQTLKGPCPLAVKSTLGLIGQGILAGLPNLPRCARAGWVIPLRPRWTGQLHPQTRTASPPALRNMRGLLSILEKRPLTTEGQSYVIYSRALDG